jgi:hypothetical protein
MESYNKEWNWHLELELFWMDLDEVRFDDGNYKSEGERFKHLRLQAVQLLDKKFKR